MNIRGVSQAEALELLNDCPNCTTLRAELATLRAENEELRAALDVLAPLAPSPARRSHE